MIKAIRNCIVSDEEGHIKGTIIVLDNTDPKVQLNCIHDEEGHIKRTIIVLYNTDPKIQLYCI